jgi:hypothetical protein
MEGSHKDIMSSNHLPQTIHNELPHEPLLETTHGVQINNLDLFSAYNSSACDYNTLEVKVTLPLTVSRSVCLGVEPTRGLLARYYFLSESCSLVSVGRPL